MKFRSFALLASNLRKAIKRVLQNRLLLLALKLLVSLSLMLLLLQQVELDQIYEKSKSILIEYHALILGLFLIQTIIASERWFNICKAIKIQTSRLALLKYFVSDSFSIKLCSSIGGDAIRIWMIKRHADTISISALSVIVDRIFGLVALFIIIVSSTLYLSIYNGDDRSFVTSESAYLAAIGLGLFVVVGIVIWNREKLFLFFNSKMKRMFKQTISGTNHKFLTKKNIAKVFLISLFIHIIYITIFYIISLSIEVKLSWSEAFLVLPPVMLAAALPISVAGWGVREAGMAFMLSIYGIPTSDAVLSSLLLGVYTLLFALPGSALWLIEKYEQKPIA